MEIIGMLLFWKLRKNPEFLRYLKWRVETEPYYVVLFWGVVLWKLPGNEAEVIQLI